MKVKLTYFKPNGKYYAGDEFDLEPGRDFPLYVYWERVEQMNRDRTLPGLNSGHWEGPISIEVPDHPLKHPHLLMPGYEQRYNAGTGYEWLYERNKPNANSK